MSPSHDNGPSRRSGNRRSRSSYHKRLISRSSQRLILAISLAASLVALVMVVTLALGRINELKMENLDLRARLENSTREIGRLRSELDRARADLAAMVDERLPYLKPLNLDEVVPIHEGYIKNIVFSRIRQGRKEVFEYKIMLENTGNGRVQPAFRVMIFDRYGIEIGMHEVKDLDELPPGESTSRNARIERFLDREPAYFAVTSIEGESIH